MRTLHHSRYHVSCAKLFLQNVIHLNWDFSVFCVKFLVLVLNVWSWVEKPESIMGQKVNDPCRGQRWERSHWATENSDLQSGCREPGLLGTN